MPVKDTFKYSARWDSVGLDCSNCINFHAPLKWPDVNAESCCIKYDLNLRIELGHNRYKKGEWFCKSFEDNGTAFKPSVEHFNGIRQQLSEDTLYGFYGVDGYLIEIDFADLRGE